jgi:endonuclease/exonuclease/phosphatase (EEP) superfamily protein YafD
LLDRLGALRYWWIWAAVVPIAFWALIRVFGLEAGALLSTLMFFTPYAAVAALMITGVAIALRNWAASFVVALATVCLAAAVLPRAIGSETVRAPEDETLTVVSANVYLGTADAAALVGLVDRLDADLLSVQELTPSFARRLRRLGLERLLPSSVLMPQPRGSGGGLYARFPLTPQAYQTRFLFRMPRGTMVLPDRTRLRVVAVHPQPPNMDAGRWKEALESLPATGGAAPWLLVGDFNATLDHAELRDVLDRGYRDAGDAAGMGLEPTWPNGHERTPPITIDHVLADRRLGIVDYDVLDQPGSDHRYVYARLALP